MDVGGGSGIRTHGGLAPTPVFKTGALNRSAIPPVLISLPYYGRGRPHWGFCYHFATECGLCARLYRASDRGVNLLCRIRLHSGHDVAIEIQRDTYAGMSKSLAGDLWMHATGQHLRSMCVPKVMKTNAGHICLSKNSHPFVRKRARLDRLPVILCNDETIVVGTNAKS